jgi:hypothetical protein
LPNSLLSRQRQRYCRTCGGIGGARARRSKWPRGIKSEMSKKAALYEFHKSSPVHDGAIFDARSNICDQQPNFIFMEFL